MSTRNIPIKSYKRRNVTPAKNWRRINSRKFLKGQIKIKLRVTATVASNAGGQITFAYSNDPSGLQDWSSVAALYDEYKVKGLKIQFYPYLPNDPSGTTGYLPLYTVIDQNSATTPLTSVNDAIQYENMKAFNMYRPWKIFRRFEKITGSTSAQVNNGYMPTASPVATACMAFYGVGYDISTSYGSVIVTAYLTLRNRK